MPTSSVNTLLFFQFIYTEFVQKLAVFPRVPGPFVSALANRYGFRTVCILGSVLGAIGFVISYFANSVTYLFFSYGVLGGKHATPKISAVVCMGSSQSQSAVSAYISHVFIL
jgi:MFS family permease